MGICSICVVSKSEPLFHHGHLFALGYLEIFGAMTPGPPDFLGLFSWLWVLDGVLALNRMKFSIHVVWVLAPLMGLDFLRSSTASSSGFLGAIQG